ncbi:regucalcin-like [Belonocnema kinseyi]|uniref:regucalcin-like n=1 Tax=Belonocnema kinseyi TaxID=2817044 RepID=UPI00143DFE56|nr:regucalcin-like [Belonocnema kinseyi]
MNTFGYSLGNVMTLSYAGLLKTHIEEVTSSSGFTWNTRAFKDVFNWSQHPHKGSARRLTIDRSGNLWVPLYEGRGVVQINPRTNETMRFIPIPADRVGGCTFGGDNWNILFVSTIGYGYKNRREQRPPADEGGTLFAVKGLGVQGWQPREYSMNSQTLEALVQSLRF